MYAIFLTISLVSLLTVSGLAAIAYIFPDYQERD